MFSVALNLYLWPMGGAGSNLIGGQASQESVILSSLYTGPIGGAGFNETDKI